MAANVSELLCNNMQPRISGLEGANDGGSDAVAALMHAEPGAEEIQSNIERRSTQSPKPIPTPAKSGDIPH